MRTLVDEGIGVFIVVERWHLHVGLQVFPFRNLFEVYFTGSFPYGNPLGFCEAWKASYFLIYAILGRQAIIGQYCRLLIPLRLWPHQPQEGVSLMKASALGCPSRLPVASFPMMNIMETDGPERYRQFTSSPSPYVVDVKRQPTHGYVIYLFFFHISCPLLHNLVDFKLTDLWSLVKLLFWAQRSEKIIG